MTLSLPAPLAFTSNVANVNDASQSDKRAYLLQRIAEARSTLVANIDERVRFEANKGLGRPIFAALKGYRRDVDNDLVAGIMLISNCDLNKINREENTGSRFNEKAYAKVIDVAQFLTGNPSLNHYTLAIVMTAFNLHKQGIALTEHLAFCALKKSAKCKVPSLSQYLVRYEKVDVSEGTASTQKSSSINALQDFNILVEGRNAQGETCFRLNTEHKMTQLMLSRLGVTLD